MDPAAYLDRIGFTETVRLDADTLEALQRAHLTAVPFENLDVYHRRGVDTAAASSVAKIVDECRGGWCFELNGAFAGLLEALGFTVTRLGATVLGQAPAPGPDHLAIEVTLDRPWLVDVGFGDSFLRPLPLDDPGPHDGGWSQYAFEFRGDEVTLLEVPPDGERVGVYRFGRTPRAMSDFDDVSRRLQTEPGLHWTQRPFATRLLAGGPDRVTLVGDELKLRRNGVWHVTHVAPASWSAQLERWFGIAPRRGETGRSKADRSRG